MKGSAFKPDFRSTSWVHGWIQMDEEGISIECQPLVCQQSDYFVNKTGDRACTVEIGPMGLCMAGRECFPNCTCLNKYKWWSHGHPLWTDWQTDMTEHITIVPPLAVKMTLWQSCPIFMPNSWKYLKSAIYEGMYTFVLFVTHSWTIDEV